MNLLKNLINNYKQEENQVVILLNIHSFNFEEFILIHLKIYNFLNLNNHVIIS